MCKAVKIQIYRMMVKPVVVYGSKTWPVTEMGMKRLNMWERKIFRKIYGPVVEQGVWRIRNNQELWELYKDLDIVADIKRRRLKLIGQLVRMDHGRVVKKMFESKPEGRERMGRTRLRWWEDVEKDLQDMKGERWRQKVVDREEWASATNETKALRRPYSQGIIK